MQKCVLLGSIHHFFSNEISCTILSTYVDFPKHSISCSPVLICMNIIRKFGEF